MAIDTGTAIGADGIRRPISERGDHVESAPYRRRSVGLTGTSVSVQGAEPDDPSENDLWVDTSGIPALAKQYLSDTWVILVAPEP